MANIVQCRLLIFNVVYSSLIFSFQITVKEGVEWVGCQWLIHFIEPYEDPDPSSAHMASETFSWFWWGHGLL